MKKKKGGCCSWCLSVLDQFQYSVPTEAKKLWAWMLRFFLPHQQISEHWWVCCLLQLLSWVVASRAWSLFAIMMLYTSFLLTVYFCLFHNNWSPWWQKSTVLVQYYTCSFYVIFILSIVDIYFYFICGVFKHLPYFTHNLQNWMMVILKIFYML